MVYNKASIVQRLCTFTNCITKIDGKKVDDAEDLDLVMLMYNLLQYSLRYSDTKGSLSFYSKDEVFDYSNDIVNSNDFRLLFKYKGKLLKNTFADAANTILKDASIAVPLKYLSNFWRSLEMLLINCRVESLFYQRKTTKNYQNSLAKDFKD